MFPMLPATPSATMMDSLPLPAASEFATARARVAHPPVHFAARPPTIKIFRCFQA